jgi:hypothetical protein
MEMRRIPRLFGAVSWPDNLDRTAQQPHSQDFSDFGFPSAFGPSDFGFSPTTLAFCPRPHKSLAPKMTVA